MFYVLLIRTFGGILPIVNVKSFVIITFLQDRGIPKPKCK